MSNAISLEYRYVTHRNSVGTEYLVWERAMPHLPKFVADCALYMYQSESRARAGDRAGASGFLIHVQSKTVKDRAWMYAVTKKHVIEAVDLCIRLNKIGGGIDVINTHADEWYLHEDG